MSNWNLTGNVPASDAQPNGTGQARSAVGPILLTAVLFVVLLALFWLLFGGR